MSDSPAGWRQTTLGVICDRPQYGWTTSAHKDTSETAALKFLRTTDITRGRLDWEAVPYCKDEPPHPEQYLLAPGDIVISRAGSVGFSYHLIDVEPAIFASYLIRFRPSRHVDGRYVAYFLQSPWYWQQVRVAAAGIALANVNAKKLAAVELPLAPRAEQKRIVAAIEEQFSRLDAGVAALEQAQRKLKLMRVSVMEAAVAGMLSSDTQVSRPKSGLPDGWSWQPLEAIITRLRNGVFVSRPGIDVTERPILRISAVRPMALNVADVRYVPRAVEVDPDGSFILKPGDLLFTRYSGNPEYVGACAMVPAQAPRLLYPDKLIRVQVDRALVDPRFVEIAANAGETRRVIRSRVKTTAGQTGISGSDLKSVPFPVPPLTVQRRIVDEVDTVLAPTKRLGEQLESMVRQSSSLRATILVSAFSGKLVPQDSNDEPVSVLLERISAERASSKGQKPDEVRSQRRRKVTT